MEDDGSPTTFSLSPLLPYKPMGGEGGSDAPGRHFIPLLFPSGISRGRQSSLLPGLRRGSATAPASVVRGGGDGRPIFSKRSSPPSPLFLKPREAAVSASDSLGRLRDSLASASGISLGHLASTLPPRPLASAIPPRQVLLGLGIFASTSASRCSCRPRLPAREGEAVEGKAQRGQTSSLAFQALFPSPFLPPPFSFCVAVASVVGCRERGEGGEGGLLSPLNGGHDGIEGAGGMSLSFLLSLAEAGATGEASPIHRPKARQESEAFAHVGRRLSVRHPDIGLRSASDRHRLDSVRHPSSSLWIPSSRVSSRRLWTAPLQPGPPSNGLAPASDILRGSSVSPLLSLLDV